MKVSFTKQKVVTMEQRVDLELKVGFTINHNNENFVPLLKHLNENFKAAGMTTTYKQWKDAYSSNQGGNNARDLSRIDVLHVNHDSIALKIYWWNDSDFAIVILERENNA